MDMHTASGGTGDDTHSHVLGHLAAHLGDPPNNKTLPASLSLKPGVPVGHGVVFFLTSLDLLIRPVKLLAQGAWSGPCRD